MLGKKELEEKLEKFKSLVKDISLCDPKENKEEFLNKFRVIMQYYNVFDLNEKNNFPVFVEAIGTLDDLRQINPLLEEYVDQIIKPKDYHGKSSKTSELVELYASEIANMSNLDIDYLEILDYNLQDVKVELLRNQNNIDKKEYDNLMTLIDESAEKIKQYYQKLDQSSPKL